MHATCAGFLEIYSYFQLVNLWLCLDTRSPMLHIGFLHIYLILHGKSFYIFVKVSLIRFNFSSQ